MLSLEISLLKILNDIQVKCLCQKHPLYMSRFIDHILCKLWSDLRETLCIDNKVFLLCDNGWLVHLNEHLLLNVEFDAFRIFMFQTTVQVMIS